VLISLYGKRWGIECGLRDTKDSRFGSAIANPFSNHRRSHRSGVLT
jgi:hypothetical protein